MTDVNSFQSICDLLLFKNLFIYPNEYYLGGTDTHLCAAYPLEHFFSPNITVTSLNSLTLKKKCLKISKSNTLSCGVIHQTSEALSMWFSVAAASNWSMRTGQYVQWNMFVIPDLYDVSTCLLGSREQYFITSINTSSTIGPFMKMVWLYFFSLLSS